MSDQVATASFPAKVVLERADARIAEIDAKVVLDRAAGIDELMASPVQRGFLFGRHDHWMTLEEATHHFDKVEVGLYMGADGPNLIRYAERHKVRPLKLRRLARAAMQSGVDGVLTLNADDCASLGIPVADDVSAAEQVSA